MIPRHARPEAAAIWAPQTRAWIMFEILAHAADKLAELGLVPKTVAAVVRDQDRDTAFDAARFAEMVGPEASRRLPTASELADTALAVQLSRVTDLLIDGVDLVMTGLKRRAFAHRLTAVLDGGAPTTVGLLLASHYAAFQRAKERLAMARFEVATCALAGPAGTFADTDPAVEAHVAEQMGLFVEPIATAGVPRDRHAAYVAGLAVVGASVERLAVEIARLQGAAPADDLAGLGRLLRAPVIPALEAVARPGEPDAAGEQATAAEITLNLDLALNRLAEMVDALTISPYNLLNNIDNSSDNAPLDLAHHFRNVDTIFARAFGEQAMAEVAN